jgi:hypothetical protein
MTEPGGRRGFLGDALFGLSGFLVWALHFLAVYVGAALLCARMPGSALTNAAILGATAAALLAFACIAVAARRRLRRHGSGRRLLDMLALFGTGIGIIAVLWEAAPAVLLPPC